MKPRIHHLPEEGYRFGYWNISGKPIEIITPITHITYKEKPMCSRRYVTRGLTFVPSRITVPELDDRGTTCVRCLKMYLKKFSDKSLDTYPKLRLGI